MSLMLEAWPADEAPQPRRARRPQHVWPWLTGVAVSVAVWAILLGANPLHDFDSLTLVAVPSALALVGVGLLARTALPGWAIVLAHFVVLPLALLTPLGIITFMESASITDEAPIAGLVYAVGCIWAATALIICGAITVARLLVLKARVSADARVSPTAGPW